MAIHRAVIVAVALALVAAACSTEQDEAAAPSGAWEERARMPTPRSEVPAVALRNAIAVAGGLDTSGVGQTAFDTVELYDPAANTWTGAPDMPDVRHHLQAAAHDGALYVFGGVDEGWVPQADVWRLNPGAAAWEVLPSMPVPIAAGAAVTVGDTIYVIAGVGAERAVLAFDPASGEWHEQAPLPERREHLAAAVLDGKIYVVGGRWPGEGESTRVDRFDPATNTWSPVAPLGEARAGHAVTVHEGGLLAAGGEVLGPGIALDSTERYEPGNDRWQPAPRLPEPTHGVAAATLDGLVYLVGGAPEANRANATGAVLVLVISTERS